MRVNRRQSPPPHRPLPTPQRKPQLSRADQQAVACGKLRASLLEYFSGPNASTPAALAEADAQAELACDVLIRRIAGPELNLMGIEYVQALPLEAWTALQSYAMARNGVGIQVVYLGSGINFQDHILIAGLAKLDLNCLRSHTPIARPVAERLFKSLERLDRIEARAVEDKPELVRMRHTDFQTPAQNLRRRNRKAWAALDEEVNRKAGHIPDSRIAVERLIKGSQDMPWGALEHGLQCALAHCVDTGNEEVTRGIARAVLTSDHPMLHTDRKISILTGGALTQHTMEMRTARSDGPFERAPKYRSPLNAGHAKEASRQIQQRKVFVPALGAFVEESENEEAEEQALQGVPGLAELEHPAQPPRPMRAPLLHALVADPWTANTPMTTAVLRYVGISTLIEEIVRSDLDGPDIEKLLASEHLTAQGPMTWAQLAMSNRHPGAVAYAMMAIAESSLDPAWQQRFVAALGVDPATVVTALLDPVWRDAPWIRSLIGKLTPGT